jgi:hypothetical protein
VTPRLRQILCATKYDTDIEQVKNAKKSFTFRWMLRQITLADSGKGQ